MKNSIKIFLFTVLVTAFYNYVGQMVPQKETYPPETIEIRADLTTDEMVEIGREIVGGKGTCLTCHTLGARTPGRYPDLANIGAIAATRREGYTAAEYLAESLYDPNAYIVEGFLPGMPIINKPPIALTDEEILCVIAYLESLGGTPTVTMQTRFRWMKAEEEKTEAETTTDQSPLEKQGRELFTKYACYTCHNIDKPDKLLGPSLYDIGAKMSKAEIEQSIMDPDAVVAEGFQKGLMKSTLTAMGVYEKMTQEELKILVDFLATRKGGQ